MFLLSSGIQDGSMITWGPCGLFVCSLTYFSPLIILFPYITLDLVCIMSHSLLYFYHLMCSLMKFLKSLERMISHMNENDHSFFGMIRLMGGRASNWRWRITDCYAFVPYFFPNRALQRLCLGDDVCDAAHCLCHCCLCF